MRVAILLIGLLVLSACSLQVTPDEILIPSDEELSSCVLDSDCVPLPSQCHPERCISKQYALTFERPEVCTEIFLVEAAYLDEDCLCQDNVCVNKNKDLAEANLPPGATKCNFRGEICTMEYHPVCGWFGKNVQCITEPCAVDASNPCNACANEDVAYWSEGSCDEA